MAGKHIFLQGRVQGVGLRYHTHEKAHALGLRGWVRNLDDGRVEILAFGSDDKVAALIEWLDSATSSVRVDHKEVADVSREFPGKEFSIRRDGGPTWPD